MPEEKVQPKQFETTDFYVAAYFKAKGHRLVDARKMPGSTRTVFCFEYAGQDMEVKRFYMEDLSINVRSFVSAIKDLKSLIK